MVELGCADTCLEVSMMSSHLTLLCKGHLEQVLHTFSYFSNYHNSEIVFDPSEPVVNEDDFEKQDWTCSAFGHVSGKEVLPHNMPLPCGLGFKVMARLDADHARDSITIRSRTGFLVYCNSAPVYWMSKKQASIESSTFGSEFTAMKQC
eukprot:15349128-Ditylum_brightwellii.AAC.1